MILGPSGPDMAAWRGQDTGAVQQKNSEEWQGAPEEREAGLKIQCRQGTWADQSIWISVFVATYHKRRDSVYLAPREGCIQSPFDSVGVDA